MGERILDASDAPARRVVPGSVQIARKRERAIMRRIRHFLVAADAFNREDIWKRLLNAGEPILVMDGVINLTISRTGIVLSLCTGDSPFNSAAIAVFVSNGISR